MTTLAANAARQYQEGDEAFIPSVASDITYEGAAVGITAGTGRPLQAGDPFAGFAIAKCDNSAGAASAASIRVKTKGKIKLPVTGVTAITDRGDLVYASDDNTFTLSSTGNSLIGVIVEYVSSTTVIVEFDAGMVLLNA